jgi:hypothetical protein
LRLGGVREGNWEGMRSVRKVLLLLEVLVPVCGGRNGLELTESSIFGEDGLEVCHCVLILQDRCGNVVVEFEKFCEFWGFRYFF